MQSLEQHHKFPVIIHNYFLAWKTYDLDLLNIIFTKDASYEINGILRYKGIREIEAYWEENSREQLFFASSVTSYSIKSDAVSFTWDADFYRRDKKQWYCLKGTMCFLLFNDKIKYLREQFSKTITKNKPCSFPNRSYTF